ncbi:hypothetical protein AB2L27_09850 [Kineococcus sp. LSe6-4]|uniref:Galactose oxidase n=1 Tax=Kineococcus halophytocola TaxID=3234027 RepID=A0ABV4H3U6_9ACTN
MTGAWAPMAPAPLAPRGSAASTVRDGRFVVAGGYVFPRVRDACDDGAGGGSCGGPAPVPRPDAAAWSAATGTWTPLPALAGVVDTYATGPALEPFLGPVGLDRSGAPTRVPITTGDDGRWVGRTFVVAGWLAGTAAQQERKPVAVASFDADTGAWTVDPWPFPGAYQQELVSVWAGDRLLAVVRAIGPGCSDQRVCRRVVTWSPGDGWHQVAEWPIDPSGAQTPGHWTRFGELLWDGRRVLGVSSGSGALTVATLSEVDGRVEEVGSLPGPVPAPTAVALHGQDVVVVVEDRVVVLDPHRRWAQLPAVPGPQVAGRAVGVVGDHLLVWGGRVAPGVAGSVDSADGWTFPLPT